MMQIFADRAVDSGGRFAIRIARRRSIFGADQFDEFFDGSAQRRALAHVMDAPRRAMPRAFPSLWSVSQNGFSGKNGCGNMGEVAAKVKAKLYNLPINII